MTSPIDSVGWRKSEPVPLRVPGLVGRDSRWHLSYARGTAPGRPDLTAGRSEFGGRHEHRLVGHAGAPGAGCARATRAWAACSRAVREEED